MPELKDLYLDPVLTNFSVGYKNEGLIADIVAPFVTVVKETGKYKKFGSEALYIEDDYRRNGAGANEVRWNISEGTYICEEHALKDFYTKRDEDNADSVTQLQITTTENLIDKISLAREERVKNAFMNGGFPSVTLNAGQKWDNYTSASSDPLGAIKTAKESVRKRCLKRATHIILPPSVSEALLLHPDITDLVKYTGGENLLTGSGMPTMLKGLRVVEPNALQVLYEGADINAGKADDVWGDNVVVLYINPNPGLKSVAAVLSHATRKTRVRRWYDNDREATIIEFSQIVGETIVCTGAAYVIKDTLT